MAGYFDSGYSHSLDRGYSNPQDKEMVGRPDIESPLPIATIPEIGQSVTEGRQFGSFASPQGQLTRAIWTGANKIELQFQKGGGMETVGPESYGREAREQIREMALANQVELTGVHTPTAIGNMSGFNLQQGGGFSDQQRKESIEEVKRAIDFAAEVPKGGYVVIHTGEYQRPISESKWAKDPETGEYQFIGFEEEARRAVIYMVDERTGKIIGDVQKSKEVREPEYLTAADNRKLGKHLELKNGKPLRDDDWVDGEGKYIDPKDTEALYRRVPKWDGVNQRFTTRKLEWKDFEIRADKWNEEHPDQPKTPAEMFFRTQTEPEILRSRGWSKIHSQKYDEENEARKSLKEAFEFYQKIEKDMPKEQQWRLLESDPVVRVQLQKFVLDRKKMPSQLIDEAIKDIDKQMARTHETSASADAQADTMEDMIKHVKPIEEYAKKQTFKSYAEAGVYALDVTKQNRLNRDVYVAPENIFPEMGYGSHPKELVELVQKSREKMAELLVSPTIEDPYGRKDTKGNLIQISNPYYHQGMNEKEAKKAAEAHIKATFDTQHLGMWRKHFLPRPGESLDQTNKRFDTWYMEQVKMLSDKGIIGNIHMVDAIGSEHQHLPIGQGSLPVAKAIDYLRQKGYRGALTSEGWGEDQLQPGRIMRQAWSALGSPVYSTHFGVGGARRWSDVEHSYFSQSQTPYFIFGNYSPSNDWRLWSEVPLE